MFYRNLTLFRFQSDTAADLARLDEAPATPTPTPGSAATAATSPPATDEIPMFAATRARLFRAFGDWIIQRAKRTPYFHIHHDDGTPYMGRWWVARVGKAPGWRERAKRMRELSELLATHDLADRALKRIKREIAQLHADEYYRWFGIRVHHIASSDMPVLHDHPWNFFTLILRGGYTEFYPLTPDGTVIARRHFGAGSFRFVRATQWHYLEVDDPAGAWTLFFSFPKVQSWGFLVAGIKVPWRIYLARRAAAAAGQKVAKA